MNADRAWCIGFDIGVHPFFSEAHRCGIRNLPPMNTDDGRTNTDKKWINRIGSVFILRHRCSSV